MRNKPQNCKSQADTPTARIRNIDGCGPLTPCGKVRNHAVMPTATHSPEAGAIAGRVRHLRATQGWTQRQLSEKSNVSLRTVEMVESGRHLATDVTYGRLALALGVALDDVKSLRGDR